MWYDDTNTNTNESPMKIDKGWFQEKLAARKMSQRKLAKVLKIDPSSLTVMLKGKRRMSLEEARIIANELSLPVTEIMRKAGIDVRDDVRKVPIAGYINKESFVTLLPKGTHDLIEAPADVATSSYALQVRAPGQFQDGWIIFVDGSHREPTDMLNKSCVVALTDGRMASSQLTRGYKAKTFNLIIQPGGSVLENQLVAWASPILWIRPL